MNLLPPIKAMNSDCSPSLLTAGRPGPARNRVDSAAFTLPELLTILVVLGFLGCLLSATLAHEAASDSRTVCVQRLARLAQAMALFAADNEEVLPPNPDDGNVTPGYNWCPGQAGMGGPQEFNPDVLRDPTRALFKSYLEGDILVYRCPEDPRRGRYQGTDLALRGQIIPSSRTVSLNGAVGTDPYSSSFKPVNGVWLDGNGSHTANRTFYCYAKMTDFVSPGPRNTFTFLEEDHRSLNDGAFGCVGPSTPQNYRIVDWPASSHDMACAVAFADGHVQMHRWLDARTMVPASGPTLTTQPGNPDIRWLAERASALIIKP
jgi:prepilin-type processing-associated H-X9-DG protein